MLDPIAQHALSPSELTQLLAAEREAEPFFAFKDADERLALFRAGRGGPVLTVGRGPEMDLSIDWTGAAGVSGNGCEVEAFPFDLVLSDLDKTG